MVRVMSGKLLGVSPLGISKAQHACNQLFKQMLVCKIFIRKGLQLKSFNQTSYPFVMGKRLGGLPFYNLISV